MTYTYLNVQWEAQNISIGQIQTVITTESPHEQEERKKERKKERQQWCLRHQQSIINLKPSRPDHKVPLEN
jgi:hypothetical protein